MPANWPPITPRGSHNRSSHLSTKEGKKGPYLWKFFDLVLASLGLTLSKTCNLSSLFASATQVCFVLFYLVNSTLS